MRILLLGEVISPHLQRWADELTQLGWEAVTASADYAEDYDGHRLGINARRGLLEYARLVEPIKRLVDDVQPQVINAHFLPTYGLAAALANLHPLVLTLWGSDILVSGGRGLLRRIRSRFVLERSDLVVGDAEYLLEEAEKLGEVRRRLMVPFGVKRVWLESGEARELTETPRLEILSCRQLKPVYDLTTVVRAAGLLKKRELGFHLTIAGEGPERRTIELLSKELDLESEVTFAGRVSSEKLLSLYRKSDVYVSAAHSDSTSVSLLEALSQKLYPVVTDIAGNREWLEEDRFLFEAGNHEQLANRIAAGNSLDARQQAWRSYWPRLEKNGVREEQMKIADLTFRKLVDEFARK